MKGSPKKIEDEKRWTLQGLLLPVMMGPFVYGFSGFSDPLDHKGN